MVNYNEASNRAYYGEFISAQWPGTCKACGDRFSTGDDIAYSEQDEGFVCDFCVPE